MKSHHRQCSLTKISWLQLGQEQLRRCCTKARPNLAEGKNPSKGTIRKGCKKICKWIQMFSYQRLNLRTKGNRRVSETNHPWLSLNLSLASSWQYITKAYQSKVWMSLSLLKKPSHLLRWVQFILTQTTWARTTSLFIYQAEMGLRLLVWTKRIFYTIAIIKKKPKTIVQIFQINETLVQQLYGETL